MSVASKNPFALLGDEDGPAPAAAMPASAAPAKAKQADTASVKRNIPGAGGNNANGSARQQGGVRGTAKSGARGGRHGESGAAAGGDEESQAQRDGRSAYSSARLPSAEA